MRYGPLYLVAALLGFALLPICLRAQQPSGTIAGVVTDPLGAVVPGASVTVIDSASHFTVRLHTSDEGVFNAPGLLPGPHEVRVQVPGFKQTITELEVEVGRISVADVRLQLGSMTETVNVSAAAVRVNPTQSALEGIVPEGWLRSLPLNGRNFLDLGQLEPGVQVTPDAIVNRGGFARLSVAGQTGLTTRVTVDGLEINDEFSGSVAMNLSADGIEEFQISRSNFDIATGLTGTGAVNIVTRSGSNRLRGGAFLLWRDSAFAAHLGEGTSFDREQAGFSVGGPFVRDRLFWFVNYERNNQDAVVVTTFPQFPQFSGSWPSPFDERMASGRLDAKVTRNVRAFLRFTHDWNAGISTLGGNKLSPTEAASRTNQTAFGLEANTGRSTHSLRLGYTNNDMSSDIAVEKIPGLLQVIAPAGRLLTLQQAAAGSALGSAITIGVHPNAPIRRSQDTHEVRYDGGFGFSRHALRWGATVNVIRINWFETLNGRAPQINFRFNQAAIDKCGSDILCYPAVNIAIGNGLGYFTEVPTLGQPHGGGKNNRFHWYVGDSWRAHPRLTLNLGLRWVYEPGPGNSDLQKPAILDDFMPGHSAPNRNDHNNFAPQAGFAWASSPQWVVRGGVGIFYEMNRLQNVMYAERSNLLPVGIAQNTQGPLLRDPNTNRVIFDFQGRNWSFPDGPALVTPGVNWAGLPIETPGLLDAIFAAQDAFRAAYQVAFANFPSAPSTCELTRACRVLAPDYQTPYSIQFNLGFQRELRPGLVVSADYVRNRSLHFMMRYNANRTGAANTLNLSRALDAMRVVQDPLQCAAGAAGVQCAINYGATLTSYVNAGLGSLATASTNGPSISAFPGVNPNFNSFQLLTMSGFSNYSALQVNLRGRLPNLKTVVTNPNVVVSYALSRLEGTAEDQAVLNVADRVDNDNPLGFRGPTSLDRTHILSAAALFTIPGGVQLNSMWKAFSPLAQTLFLPQQVGGGGEIFMTDLNGDGTGQDVLPGTNRGSYGRDLGCGTAALNRVIGAYNSTQAGNLTPAGEALVTARLFTRDQLVTLGAVSPRLEPAPTGQVCLDWFVTTDVRIARPFKLKGERITVEPALEWFNLFNVANYDLPDNKLSGSLNAAVGSLNGTTGSNRPNRAGGTGSFVLGAPRSWQLLLRITF